MRQLSLCNGAVLVVKESFISNINELIEEEKRMLKNDQQSNNSNLEEFKNTRNKPEDLWLE